MLHQNVPEPAGRCVADEAAMRQVHEHGHVPWLARVAGFLVPQAPGPGPSSADSWSVVEAESVLGRGGGRLNPSAVLCSRRPPGRLRKSQGIWRCSHSIPDGHELAFQMRSPPSRGAWLANGRRGSREPWEIHRRQIPNGAACRG